jgi:pimeloyl-ACP methyl ester carboxylesterase
MKLYFKKIGEGSPLLIVHGLFGSADNWGTLAKKLAINHTVYLIDLRNHGRSPHSELMTYDLMADDLFNLINDEEIHNPVLLGHSMGGKAALEFSKKYPNVLRKLIIADIGIKSYPMHHDVILKGLKNVNLNLINTRNTAQQALSEFVKEVGIQQFLLKNLYWIEKGKLAWRMNLSVIAENIHEILKEIKVDKTNIQTLFLRGELSDYILEEDYSELFNKFPNSEIKTIVNAGHWLHAENPKDFFKEVNDFIS